MNYYEHHIGDYDAATAHLSMLEDAAYSRLMRLYYRKECPIPADIATACRLIRASSKDERKAVETVLREFFVLGDDGWHQVRCDADIARYLADEPDREAKKENAKERQQRARERRKALFELLRSHGQVPAFDTAMSELQSLASRVTDDDKSRHVTHPVTRDATISQSPYPVLNTTPPTPSRGPGRATAVHGFQPGFDDFWAKYPRKDRKQDAAKAFARAKVDDALLPMLLAAVERQRLTPQWTQDGGRFVPHAATWLNGKRWEDGASDAASGDPFEAEMREAFARCE